MDVDKAPVYFTPETFQLRKELRLKKAKKLRKAIKKWNSRKVTKNEHSHVKIKDSVQTSVNFLSSFPAKDSKITNKNTVNIFSSTDSDDGSGFEGVKSTHLSSTTESESDESFTIVFSETKRKQGQKVKQTKVKKKRACSSRLSTLPSESDSDSSFDICFERDEIDPNDSFDDEGALSDSDSLASNSNKETVPTFSGCHNLKKMDDSWPSECADKESVDVCDGIGFSGPRRPRKKVRFDSEAPKVHTIVAWEYAYRQARIGPWEMCARDGERFRKRIKDTSGCLEWVFGSEHRSRIFFQRFKPLLTEQVQDQAPGFEDEVEM